MQPVHLSMQCHPIRHQFEWVGQCVWQVMFAEQFVQTSWQKKQTEGGKYKCASLVLVSGTNLKIQQQESTTAYHNPETLAIGLQLAKAQQQWHFL